MQRFAGGLRIVSVFNNPLKKQMMKYLALGAICCLLFFTACNLEDSLLITETELPEEVVIIEEEPDFLTHQLGAVVVEDTVGSAFYSDDFGWFQLYNLIWDQYDCTVSASGYSFSGSGSGGGN
ncbi:MAG: hypothetical protein AAFU03_01305, partial [Bacteroidota bacterium]